MGYRLPTDAEWIKFSSLDPASPYADSDTPSSVGWVRDNSNVERHPVCELKRNGYQLCDITGNVWEWCWDTPERDPNLDGCVEEGLRLLTEVALRENGVDFPANWVQNMLGFDWFERVDSQLSHLEIGYLRFVLVISLRLGYDYLQKLCAYPSCKEEL